MDPKKRVTKVNTSSVRSPEMMYVRGRMTSKWKFGIIIFGIFASIAGFMVPTIMKNNEEKRRYKAAQIATEEARAELKRSRQQYVPSLKYRSQSEE